MAKKTKKTPSPPRDPYWRSRRALGAKREPTGREYDRAAEKARERGAKRDTPERDEP